MSKRVLIFHFLLLGATVSEEHCDAVDATGNTIFDEDNELLQVNADHASVAATVQVMEDSIKDNSSHGSSHDLAPSFQTVSRTREEMDLHPLVATLTIKTARDPNGKKKYSGCTVRDSKYKRIGSIDDGTVVDVDLSLGKRLGEKNQLMEHLPKHSWNKWSNGWVAQNCFTECTRLNGETCYDKMRNPLAKDADHAIDRFGAIGAGYDKMRTGDKAGKGDDVAIGGGGKAAAEDKAAHADEKAAKRAEAATVEAVERQIAELKHLPSQTYHARLKALLEEWTVDEGVGGFRDDKLSEVIRGIITLSM